MEKENQGNQYRYVIHGEGGYDIVGTADDRCNIRRPDGTMMSDSGWDFVAGFREGLCRVTQDRKDSFIRHDGTPLTKEKYDWASYHFKGGYAKVLREGSGCKGSGYNIIRKDGTEVFNNWYPDIEFDSCELPAGIAVIKNDDGSTISVFDMEAMSPLDTIDDIVKYANTSYRVDTTGNSYVAAALPADEVQKRRQLARKILMKMDKNRLALHILDNCGHTVAHENHQCCPHYSSNV